MKIYPFKERYKTYRRRKTLNKYTIKEEDHNGVCPICIADYGKETLVKLTCKLYNPFFRVVSHYSEDMS